MRDLFRLFLVLIALAALSGCTQQERAKTFGGNMDINLDPGLKLENVTWKDNHLWTLTRAMRAGETPETHVFAEKSSWGVMQGKVTIHETAAARP